MKKRQYIFDFSDCQTGTIRTRTKEISLAKSKLLVGSFYNIPAMLMYNASKVICVKSKKYLKNKGQPDCQELTDYDILEYLLRCEEMDIRTL